MTKRFGNFTTSNNKKQKTEENLDDLWGDNLDAKDVEDCFILATQIWEQDNVPCTQRNNVSILPHYSVFQQKSKRIFTSTQSDPELKSSLQQPSTSKAPATNGISSVKGDSLAGKSEIELENVFKRTRSFGSSNEPHFEAKAQKLQEQYVAKEGEVSILRMQLKEIRTNNENEHAKKNKEWNEKYTTAVKQLNSVKSELEFKNLEIANLKQKVVEVAKHNNLDASFSFTQSQFFKQPKVPERSAVIVTEVATTTRANVNEPNFKLQPVLETNYPLKDVISPSLFTYPKEEKYLIDIKTKQICRNTIPFLQNQMSQDLTDKLIKLQPKTTIVDDDRLLYFDYVYSDVAKLMKCDLNEISGENCECVITKMLCVSEQLLQNMHQFLQELERSAHAENQGKIDVMYLECNFENINLNQSLFDAKQWCENEMGVAARQSIACISEILPYNSYLRGYLLQNKPLIFTENETYLQYLPIVKSKLKKENNFDYLNSILSVVTSVKRLKKSNNFLGLLSAASMLLGKICSCFKIDDINGIIYNIVREIVLCSPNMEVLSHFTEFLKDASLQNVFVNDLCKMPQRNVLQVKHKERILYYHQDTTCILQILCILLEDCMTKLENNGILRVYLNISELVFNCIECNPRWLFYQENKYCDCLSKIVKLYVEIMYRTVGRFQALNKEELQEASLEREILRSVLKILHIQNFRVYDLIVKYITTYSQYKVVVKLLLNLKSELNLTECDVEILENLNLTEELPILERKAFHSVALWN